MRIAFVRFAYPAYLDDHARRFPHAHRRPYDAQKRALDHDAFWWGDAWEDALGGLGHPTTDLVMNAESLQKAWAVEHGMKPARLGWMLPILERQLRMLGAEVVFVQSFRGLDRRALEELRGRCPSIRKVIGWCGAPPVRREVFAACDVMLSCVPEIVEELRRAGHRAALMHHAFDPRVLERIGDGTAPAPDVSFVGSIEDEVQHGPRAEFLATVGRRLPLHVYALQRRSALGRFCRTMAGKAVHAAFARLISAGLPRTWLQAVPTIGVVATWSHSPRHRPAPVGKSFLHPAIYGLPMFEILQRSKVTLNVHSAVSPRSASNLRLFEATGVGACLVTEARQNLHELFAIDDEIVTYRSPEECIDRIGWLLDHPTERARIAAAARRRALREHTFAARATILDGVLRSF